MKKSLRNILIFLGIAVLLFIMYFAFFNRGTRPAQTTSSLSSTARTSATAPLATSPTAGSQLLSLLGRVNGLALNDDIFSNPAFAALQDISITLPPIGLRGRRNPFAPIGTNNAPLTTSVTTESPQQTETTTGSGTIVNPQ